MKKLLQIAFEFPPIVGPGTIRPEKFHKFLPDLGWCSSVLTVDCGNSNPKGEQNVFRAPLSSLWGIRKRSLGFQNAPLESAQQPRNSAIPTRALELPRQLLTYSGWSGFTAFHYPDLEAGWLKAAIVKGRQLLRAEKFDAILSTFPPVTCHRVAAKLSKEFNIPWLADYRDEWSTEKYWMPRSGAWEKLDRFIERKAVRHASEITTVSAPIAENLEKLHGLNVTVVPNGFDPDDYPSNTVSSQEKFTLTFTGTLSTKSFVEPLLQAVSVLASQRRITAQNFELRFVGRTPAGFETRVSALTELKLITFHGWVDYKESLRMQVDSTALFFPCWVADGSEGVLSSKIFTYLGSNRPILFLGSQDHILSKLLTDTKSGSTAATADECFTILNEWLCEWESCRELSFSPDKQAVLTYSRKEQAREIAKVLNRICNVK